MVTPVNNPTTAQEMYLDAALRHQVGIRRYTAGEVRNILSVLEKSDVEITELLRKRLGKLAGGPVDFTSERYLNMLREVKRMRQDVMNQLRMQTRDDLIALSKIEYNFEERMLKSALPVQLDLKTDITALDFRAIVVDKPFSGGPNATRTLNQWYAGLTMNDQRRINDAIQMGIAQGETVDQMARRIAGTRAASYSDGILAMTRREAEAVVRTAANHVSNATREMFWQNNSDIVEGAMWNSTLDGRTTPICQSRDGGVVTFGDKPLPKGVKKLDPPTARPPAHPNCRSVMVAILDVNRIAEALPDRPFVRDSRTRREREIDFRADAKERVGANRWSKMDTDERRAAINREKRRWSSENIGTVPATTNYNQWLGKQPASFQDEVLGKTRGQLFRNGDMQVDQFVDRRGNELTLAQLAQTTPEAFDEAGLDADDF